MHAIGTDAGTRYKSLFVNGGFTSHTHATKPQFTVRYHWHAGDLGFWDNRVTQHSVAGDYAGQHRVIQRVTLRGDKPE